MRACSRGRLGDLGRGSGLAMSRDIGIFLGGDEVGTGMMSGLLIAILNLHRIVGSTY